MQFIVIENEPEWAKLYDETGVHRVMVDLETLGKAERQGHMDTVRSNHSVADIAAVRSVLKRAKLMVRVNPWNPGSPAEIEAVVNQGADIVMLPMFRTSTEVSAFVSAVSGRARTCLLLETTQALTRAPEIVSIAGTDEFFIGLNDLSLGLGVDFLFEPLAGGLVDHLAAIFKTSAKPFGFGGVGPLEGGDVPGRYIIQEHARVGSELVILSRTFRSLARSNPASLRSEVDALQAAYQLAAKLTPAAASFAADEAHTLIRNVAERRRATGKTNR